MNAAVAKAGDAAAVSDQLKTAGDIPSFAPTFVKAPLNRPMMAMPHQPFLAFRSLSSSIIFPPARLYKNNLSESEYHRAAAVFVSPVLWRHTNTLTLHADVDDEPTAAPAPTDAVVNV